jgi:hypothetical protein
MICKLDIKIMKETQKDLMVLSSSIIIKIDVNYWQYELDAIFKISQPIHINISIMHLRKTRIYK